ncbi:glutaredoxin family protein [Paucisalibacillus globulus]|uniref:glutaredoxin family protein n=1 Tax=Paucisalibacillus globulus TaxID=351095 RepID=UPI000BB99C98|nr:glutaredoxin family protein [Paucisalibacillus globulus]
MNPYITVYTSTLCPVCGMVKQFLDTFDISYNEVNVDMNPLVLLKLIGKTRKLSVPQTEVNGKWISGFDPEKLLKAINEARA